jgi:hypothetical protein
MDIKVDDPKTTAVLEELVALVGDHLDQGAEDESQADIGRLLSQVAALAMINAEITLALLRERQGQTS